MNNSLFLYSSRILAASLDMFVVQTVCRFLVPLIGGHFSFFSLSNFIITGFYFTVAHSYLLNGQTPGKLLFGLRVYNIKTKTLLSFNKSFLRYLIFPGSVILLAEVPANYFRKTALVASPFFLEFNMLLALSIFLITSLLFFLSPQRKSLQDWLGGSIVVRESEQNLEDELKVKTKWSKKQSLAALFSLLLATTLWLFGLNGPEKITSFHSYKYFLEAKSKEDGQEFRIAGSTFQNGQMLIAIFYLQEPNVTEIKSSLNEILSTLKNKGFNLSGESQVKFLCQTAAKESFEFLAKGNQEITQVSQDVK